MTIELVLTHEEIDKFIAEAASMREKGHAEWSEYVGQRKFVLPHAAPRDPESREYLDFQLDLWRVVSGRDEYVPQKCELDGNLHLVDGIMDTYPFVTKNPKEVKNYFSAVNAIYEKLSLPPQSKIVEFGVGWGHTTRFLADCGFDVTAVDIEERFLKLIPIFSHKGAQPIELVHASFVDAELDDASFDAALFFECFHHCIEYKKLIENLRKVLRPGGKIVFCAEPFYDDWFDYPWGLRLDGYSVWAIRSMGWMELGFRKGYIESVLIEAGFSCHWSDIDGIDAYGSFLVAVLND